MGKKKKTNRRALSAGWADMSARCSCQSPVMKGAKMLQESPPKKLTEAERSLSQGQLVQGCRWAPRTRTWGDRGQRGWPVLPGAHPPGDGSGVLVLVCFLVPPWGTPSVHPFLRILSWSSLDSESLPSRPTPGQVLLVTQVWAHTSPLQTTFCDVHSVPLPYHLLIAPHFPLGISFPLTCHQTQ